MGTRSILIAPAGKAVAASQTDYQISEPFSPPAMGPLHLKLVLSAAVEATGITFKVKDSYDGGTSYYDVGSEAQVALVKKTFAGGTADVTDVTLPAFAGATQADYLHVTAQDGTKFAIWLDLDAAGTAPTGALYVASDEQIEVDIVTGDTAAQVATKVRAALLANAEWTARFSTSAITTATFTITQLSPGAVDNPAPKSENDGGAGSITVSVTTAGSDGGVVLATNRLTSSSHGWSTGQPVILTGSDVPAGLTSGTTYYLIRVDANTLELATSLANALAGTEVDITDYGSGTCTLVQADYEIRMIRDDSSDYAQMPLFSPCIVVANTGSGDSCTVSSLRLSEG